MSDPDEDGEQTWVTALSEEVWARRTGPVSARTPIGPVVVWGAGDVPHGAFIAACPHRRAPLDPADVADDVVVCSRHGAAFALEDGQVVDTGALRTTPGSLSCLDVRLREGRVEVSRRVPAVVRA